MENNRNFFITIALSILILTVWQVFYMNPRIERQREVARIEQERTAQQDQSVASPGGTTPAIPTAPGTGVPGASAVTQATDRAGALASSGRVKIDPSSSAAASPAEKAGIRPGDVITRANGELLTGLQDLSEMLSGMAAGDVMTLDMLRTKKAFKVEVTLDVSSR